MEFKETFEGLVSVYGTLRDNNTPQPLREELCSRLLELQASRTRKVALEEMLALETQNRLLDQIKNSINSKLRARTSKDIQETFETSRDCESSICYPKTDREISFLLEPERRTKQFIGSSPRNRISRRGNFSSIDLEGILQCVHNSFGFETSETLRSMLDSSTENSSKYRTLYQKEKMSHQATELNRRDLAARIQKLMLKVEQLEKEASKEQVEKINASKKLSMIQSKESRLLKLQTKLLIKQKMLKQEQKHLETLKSSIQKDKEILESQYVSVGEVPCKNEVVEGLKISLDKRRKSCREYESRLQEQFLAMGELISKLEDPDPYNI